MAECHSECHGHALTTLESVRKVGSNPSWKLPSWDCYQLFEHYLGNRICHGGGQLECSVFLDFAVGLVHSAIFPFVRPPFDCLRPQMTCLLLKPSYAFEAECLPWIEKAFEVTVMLLCFTCEKPLRVRNLCDFAIFRPI